MLYLTDCVFLKELMDRISNDGLVYIVLNFCSVVAKITTQYLNGNAEGFNDARYCYVQFMAVSTSFVIVSNRENDAYIIGMSEQAEVESDIYYDL